jgi:hypothetical protein
MFNKVLLPCYRSLAPRLVPSGSKTFSRFRNDVIPNCPFDNKIRSIKVPRQRIIALLNRLNAQDVKHRAICPNCSALAHKRSLGTFCNDYLPFRTKNQ